VYTLKIVIIIAAKNKLVHILKNNSVGVKSDIIKMTFGIRSIVEIHRLHTGDKDYAAPLVFKNYGQWSYWQQNYPVNPYEKKGQHHLLREITLTTLG